MSTVPQVRADAVHADSPRVSVTGSSPWQGLAEVQQAVLGAIRSRAGALVIGGAGAGKTTLLRSVASVLRQNGTPASLVADGDDLPPRSHVMLVDDAHLLDPDAWEEVTRRGGVLVLAGTQALLGRPTASRQRLVRLELPGLTPGDLPAFVANVLRQAGERVSLVPVSSMAALYEQAGPLPGRVAETVRLAVFLAQLEGAATVDPGHIQQASALGAERGPSQVDEVGAALVPAWQARKPASRTIVLVAIAGLAGLIVPLVMRAHRRPDTVPATAPRADAASSAAVELAVGTPGAAPAPTPASAAVDPLPQGERLHVTVTYSGDDVGARSMSKIVVLQLRSQGLSVADPVRTRVATAGTTLRYYFTDDAEPANGLASAIGIDPAAVRMADADPRRPMRPGAADITVGASVRQDH